MKYDFGEVTNPKTGKVSKIIVKATTPNNLIDILIGCGTVLVGIAYLAGKAFYHGAEVYEKAELDALVDADLTDYPDENGDCFKDDHLRKWKF